MRRSTLGPGSGVLGTVLLLLSCSMQDGDRCANGLVYQPQLKACAHPPDAAAEPADSAPPATIEDAALSEAGPVPLFGTVCTTAGDCKSAATDYCVVMPGSAGYCSKSNCAADCPGEYQCCNCAAFGMVACLKNADAVQAAAYGCSCTGAAAAGPSFGTTCTSATDCTSATTDYCVAMPGSSGYCSKSNCSTDCPANYKCCNCAAFGMVACLKSGDAVQAASFGCSCS